MRKIPVLRINFPRLTAREIFRLWTGIFRKYPSQTWYICIKGIITMVIIFFIIHIISILHLASLRFQNVLKKVPPRREEMFEAYKGCNINCGNRRTYNTMSNRIRPHNVRQNTTQKAKDWATQTQLRTRMNSGNPEM